MDPGWTEPNNEKLRVLNILTKTLELVEGKVKNIIIVIIHSTFLSQNIV